eukprot:CAMPEP_0179163622 /NCGR_PEP_ID=MMETSP0796-20121207/80241_1 /TAXON_ID=73915 /ORGANISM="Pyrodinium bahamense, Strain pbaha01" /LENGTH=40 /DNA_ID= /DNA_START= /DNA_END= /DNA_ORIENTATION=
MPLQSGPCVEIRQSARSAARRTAPRIYGRWGLGLAMPPAL